MSAFVYVFLPVSGFYTASPGEGRCKLDSVHRELELLARDKFCHIDKRYGQDPTRNPL